MDKVQKTVLNGIYRSEFVGNKKITVYGFSKKGKGLPITGHEGPEGE
jgi:hypothetical protein